MFVSAMVEMFTPLNLALMCAGCFIGISFGAIPGLGSTTAIALCLSFTYSLAPESAFAFLLAIFVGGISGGLISAVLINIPGTAAAVATTFDGHPMAKGGHATKALGTGVVASFFGAMYSFIIMAFATPFLAGFALKFGAWEYFSIAFFSLTLISVLSGDNLIKGLFSGFLGLAIALVGVAPIDGYTRFTFGVSKLATGIGLVPAMVGVFAVAEIIENAASQEADIQVLKQDKVKGFGFTLKEMAAQVKNFLIAANIGTFVGILPGLGAATCNLMSYAAVKKASKHPEKFGTGIMDGIVASEASNNATIGGAMVPMIALGIPGDAVTAMLLGALILQGFVPGPMLMKMNGSLVYSMWSALIVSTVIMLIMEFFGIPLFVKMLKIPNYILLPSVMVLCAIGAISLSNRTFDLWVLIIFGFCGYILKRFKFPVTPIVLGMVLGNNLETYLRRAVQMGRGSYLPFVTRPISLIFLTLAAFMIISTIVSQIKKHKSKTV